MTKHPLSKRNLFTGAAAAIGSYAMGRHASSSTVASRSRSRSRTPARKRHRPASRTSTRLRSRSSGRGSRRSNTKGNGTADLPGPSIVHKDGKRKKANKKFALAVQRALAATNAYNIVDNQPMSIVENECDYVIPSPVLMNNSDLNTIRTSIVATSGFKTAKFQIEDSALNHQMVNMSTNIINVRAYYCKTRRDIPGSEPLGVQGGAGTTQLYSGFTDAVGSTVTRNSLGSTLYNNPRFVIFNKILKVHTFKMMPGEERNFSIKHKSARQIRAEFIANGDFEEMRGTTFYVFQVWGGVVASASLGGIATGTCEVAFVTNRRYNYTWSDDIVSSNTESDTLAAVGAPNEKIINPDTDTSMANTVV